MPQTDVAQGSLVADRYALVERLEGWGAGETWSATDASHGGRSVCLKLLPIAAGDAAARRFHLHARRLRSSLRHDNIVATINHGLHGGRAFLVHEMAPGGSLAQGLADLGRRGSPLAPAVIEALFRGICLALSHAHMLGQPVVHGALGAHHVRVNLEADQLDVRVLDFGLEALLGLERTAVAPPPEGLRPYEALDPTIDVYQVGMLLLDVLLAGCARGPGEGAGTPAGNPGRRDDTPASVWEVARFAVAPDPGARFADAFQLLAALTQAWQQPLPSVQVPAVSAGPAATLVDPDLQATIAADPPAVEGRPEPPSLYATAVLPPTPGVITSWTEIRHGTPLDDTLHLNEQRHLPPDDEGDATVIVLDDDEILPVDAPSLPPAGAAAKDPLVATALLAASGPAVSPPRRLAPLPVPAPAPPAPAPRAGAGTSLPLSTIVIGLLLLGLPVLGFLLAALVWRVR